MLEKTRRVEIFSHFFSSNEIKFYNTKIFGAHFCICVCACVWLVLYVWLNRIISFTHSSRHAWKWFSMNFVFFGELPFGNFFKQNIHNKMINQLCKKRAIGFRSSQIVFYSSFFPFECGIGIVVAFFSILLLGLIEESNFQYSIIPQLKANQLLTALKVIKANLQIDDLRVWSSFKWKE